MNLSIMVFITGVVNVIGRQRRMYITIVMIINLSGSVMPDII